MKKAWTGERLEPGIYGEVSIEHLHRYAVAMELAENKAVLDIACGEGYGASLLATKALSVQAADMAAPVIEAAAKKYKRPNLSFTVADAAQLPFNDASFDLVISFETLEHVDNQEGMMLELKRVLKPGGLLILSTPDKKWYTDHRQYQNPHHVKELYREELVALLNRHFRYQNICGQQFFSGSMIMHPEGKGYHTFSGNFEAIRREEDRPLYLLALASDHTLPALSNSVFRSDNLYEAALLKKENELRSTFTYRTGKLVLWPFKWIKKILGGA